MDAKEQKSTYRQTKKKEKKMYDRLHAMKMSSSVNHSIVCFSCFLFIRLFNYWGIELFDVRWFNDRFWRLVIHLLLFLSIFLIQYFFFFIFLFFFKRWTKPYFTCFIFCFYFIFKHHFLFQLLTKTNLMTEIDWMS